MKPDRTTARVLAVVLTLLPLCSCATWPDASPPGPASELPGELTMNKNAGRGDLLIVNLRLESGEELPFALDTGSPLTVFPKSFEPKLGKRFGTVTLDNFGKTARSGRYATPKLYLGATRLMTGTNAVTYSHQDLFPHTRHPDRGLLGMDTLKHYCIQLDFAAGKIRFLRPEQVDPAALDNAFPLKFTKQGCPWIEHGSLIGEKGARLRIDAGYDSDGGMEHGLLRRQVWRHKGAAMGERAAFFPECTWDGQTYTNLIIGTWPTHTQAPNLMGLRFLARHLVTFDFPRRTIYLKRTSIGPLPDVDLESAANFLRTLKTQGQLPGWSKDEHGEISWRFEALRNRVVFTGQKDGDSFRYHYMVGHQCGDGAWKLQRAWRTDPKGQMTLMYSLP